MSDAVNDRLRIALFAGIVLAIIVALGLLSDVRTAHMSAEQGTVDLSRMNFADRAFAVKGGWLHFPGELRSPASMRGAVGAQDAPGAAVGSYSLRIAMPDDSRYVMNLDSIDYATRVFINGEWVDDIGLVDARRESAVPRTERTRYEVRPVNGWLDVALHYANHWHIQGGEATIITIGTPEIMAEREARHIGYAAVLIGYLLSAALLNMGFYLSEHGVRGHLYFALMCMLILIRQGLTGDQLFSTVISGVPWRALIAMEYLSLVLLTSVAIEYVGAVFPGLMWGPVRVAVHAVGGLYALAVLCMDSLTYTDLLSWYFALLALTILYVAFRLAARRRDMKGEQLLSMAGIWLFSAAALGEIILYRVLRVPLRTPFPLMSTAMALFVLIQGYSMLIATRVRVQQQNARLALAEARYEEAIRTRAERPAMTVADLNLTQRESQVAYLLIDGKSRAEIAESLRISLGTVNTYCSRIYQKTGVAGREELIRLLLMRG